MLEKLLSSDNSNLEPYARATLLVQAAMHQSHLLRGEQGSFENILTRFDQAIKIFEECQNDVRGAWALRQKALFLERSFTDGKSDCLVLAIATAEQGANVATRGLAPDTDPRVANPDDRFWHRPACLATKANLMRLELGQSAEGSSAIETLQTMGKIAEIFDQAELLQSKDFRWGCAKPGYDHRALLLEMAYLNIKIGRNDDAVRLFMRVEEGSIRSVWREAEQYKGSPRPYNTGLDTFTLAQAEAGLGRTESALKLLAIAEQCFGEKHPDMVKQVRAFTSSILHNNSENS